MYNRVLMPFTYVRYTGETLSGEIGNKVGEVIKHLPTGGYVVDFGGNTYLVNDGSIVEHSFAEKEKGPEIVRRRRSEDDE